MVFKTNGRYFVGAPKSVQIYDVAAAAAAAYPSGGGGSPRSQTDRQKDFSAYVSHGGGGAPGDLERHDTPVGCLGSLGVGPGVRSANMPFQVIENQTFVDIMEPSKGKSPTACALCAPRSSTSTTTTLTHPNRRAFELLAKQKEQFFSSTLNTTTTSIMVSRCPSVCSLERRYEILSTRNLFSDSLKSPYPLLCLPSKAVGHSTATADPARLLDAPAVPSRVAGSSFSLLPQLSTFDFVFLSPSLPLVRAC